MGLKIGIVGATGAVGQKMIEVILERNIDVDNFRLFASKNSAGKIVKLRDKDMTVELLTEEVMKEKYDYLLFAAGGSISEKFAPIAADAGNIVIDNSSHFRMMENIPLVIPEVNSHVLRGYRGIIANPNCSTTQMIVAIAPIYKKYGIKRIVVSTYQAVSGSGYKAIEELENQIKDKDYPNKVYTRKIAGNCIPHIDVFNENGFTKEELKMVYETHKILDDESIEINPTAVRIPVFYGHSESVYLELKEEVNIKEIRSLLEKAEGIVLEDEPSENKYPTPLQAENTDYTYVGRLRKDIYDPKGLSLWVVADNLRKGAATNAVQIIEAIETIKLEG
ncbi:aspartate-semialdehyde dehydrogenase [Tissierella pigra]|uniref:Aspartate-semialdehyde dehydrogenase n=1 Tax=Tissierella pigra TaxID=2607614 RepID=A0A6N7XXC7_9FIRM|nr:aspartate-semialdehyde dehydrogenase [Tissierella pigra]MBU5425258.1 aspartate-semialdehyde dehydrogenase [Tissierella pigra]MSU02103.1 aspartate-semialdehyde dehydrogenase [Tissierella pigra]